MLIRPGSSGTRKVPTDTDTPMIESPMNPQIAGIKARIAT